MKIRAAVTGYTRPVATSSLTVTMGRDVNYHLNGADRAVRDALEKAQRLPHRADVAALIGDLERLLTDIAETRAAAKWFAKGQSQSSKSPGRKSRRGAK